MVASAEAANKLTHTPILMLLQTLPHSPLPLRSSSPLTHSPLILALTLNPRTEAAAATETGEDLRSRILIRYLNLVTRLGVLVCVRRARERERERETVRGGSNANASE